MAIYPRVREEHQTGSLELSFLCCWRLLSVLLRTFFFEFFSFFIFFDRTLVFFDRTLVSVDVLVHLLGSNTNWKGLMWRLMCRANWQSQRVRYFLLTTKLRWSRKERKGTKTPGVGLLANMIDGPERPTPFASWTDKDVCQRPCAITFGPYRRCPLWKKFGCQPVR